MLVAITKENFDTVVLKANKGVVVDVYAHWCAPCQYMMPTVEEVAAEKENNYVFAKLNVDEAREIAMQYGVTSIPTFLFFKNGTLQGRETGILDKEEFIEKIETYLGQ